MNSIDPSRTAVVLGASFLGVYAHAGFLNGLVEAGFHPDRLVGASAGALAGSLFASGLRGEALREAALDVKLRRSFTDAGVLYRLPGLISTLWASGLFSGEGAVAHLRSLLGNVDLGELEMRLELAVTQVETAATEILRRGPLAELVMASCAVPGLFTVQVVNGEQLLDGGIGGELPFEHLIEDSSIDTLVLHSIRHERGSTPAWFRRNAIQALAVTRHTISREAHQLRLRLAREHGKRVIELKTTTPFPGFLTHKRAEVCYQRGMETGLSAIPQSH